MFVGFTNFYRRFIEGFSRDARALFDLTKKDLAFRWSAEADSAFRTLKEKITSAPVLILPDESRPYRLKADSSEFATGAVLLQESSEDGKWHPVAFYSKSLSPVERNYEIHDKELLAIIRALEEWRHFLEGAEHPVEIWTDHKNLEYFRSAQKLNRRQARWSLYLSRFDYTLTHRPGTSMGEPDALSRRSDHGSGSDDNENVVLLSPDVFTVAALTVLRTTGEEAEVLRDIRASIRLNTDDFEDSVIRAIRQLRKSSTASLRSAEWSESDGLIHFLGKVYVPPTGDLRRRIVYQHHDTRVAGHPGRFKTLELVSRNYWWPQMSRYVGAYTRHCDVCLRTKTRRRLPVGLLVPSETPSERWEEISVDLIVELPPAHGYDAIMVVTDMLSKRAHALPCHSDIDSVGVARLFYRHIWKLHGVFQAVRSDRGTQFVSEFTEELYRLLGIRMNTSTAHHPQTDGQTERVNQEVEQYLRVFCNFRQDDWDELLPSWEFTFNNSVHAATQQTPFVLDTGRNPRMGFEPRQPPSRLPEVNRFVAGMKESLEEAKAAIVKAKEEQARYYNRRRAPAPTFAAGDLVWLDASDINQARPARKLSHRFLGPYEVVRPVGTAAYKLKLPPELSRLHDVFPVVKLEKAERDPITQRIPPPAPPPVLVDGEEEWEVETVLDFRARRYGRPAYLVKWKGYEERSWVRPEDLVNAPDAVADFHRRHPGVPRPETISVVRLSDEAFRAMPFRHIQHHWLPRPPSRRTLEGG